MADPEHAYNLFIQHTLRCPQCRAAGGEMAEERRLCGTGRALARQWGAVEEELTRDEYERSQQAS